MEGGWCTNNQRASTSAGGPAVAIRRRATIFGATRFRPGGCAAGAARQPPTADALFCLTILLIYFIFFVFKFPGKYFWLFSFSGSFILKMKSKILIFFRKLWKQIWI
jgi:hypothetical protein